MVKATDGLDLEKGQAHSIVQEKSQSGMHVHIGQYLNEVAIRINLVQPI